VEPSPIRYTKAGDVHIAYRTLGEGPIDLVFVSGAVSNLQLAWDRPEYVAFERRLASFSRLVTFDRRGVGISDRVARSSLEEQMDDVRAVMDAAGSERAALFGFGDGGALLALFAATYPQRVLALVLYATQPRWTQAPDYPWGLTREQMQGLVDTAADFDNLETTLRRDIRRTAPSMVGDDDFIAWLARWVRLSISPAAFAAYRRMYLDIDVRHVLPTIRVPTLVVDRPGEQVVGSEISRYVADHIPTSAYVELPGRDYYPWGDDAGALVDTVEAFVTEAAAEALPEEPERVLVTILFTDIVDATSRAAHAGDAAWCELLREHHTLVRRQLARFRGQELDTAGDGFLVSFDGPARAIRCATAIVDGVGGLGLELRAGLHTGECELLDGKVAGIAVHIGARVAAEAAPGEILVSSTVKDLVAGSGLQFEDRGERELKGVPGKWRLYAVESSS
jgi:class 3 adenylate cyclase